MLLSVFCQIRELQRDIDDLQRQRDSLYNAAPTMSEETAAEQFAIDQKLSEKVERKQDLTSEVLSWIYSRPEQSEIRKIIIHRYIMSETWKETAQAVGITEKEVKALFHRFLKDS